MKEVSEMSLKELLELQQQVGKVIEERTEAIGDIVLTTEESIQTFLDELVCNTIREFKVLKWTVDPEFRIVTDKRSFTLHSNDIGIFIDEILERE